jgi:4-amino-4-deoxychorismate lyase
MEPVADTGPLPGNHQDTARVVAVLGRGVVPADTPILRADDLGVLRGDGVFETLHVRGGTPFLLDAHLTRMADSAAKLDLPLPNRNALADLAAAACAAWSAKATGSESPECALRMVCTRGPEDGGPVTCYATVTGVGAVTLRARREGIRVATASLGFAADARTGSPWLLGGVKSLSYAVNMASQRWANDQGRDDVLWLSSDGYALEAPTSTLVWLTGTELWTVPTTTGILPGITARYLFDHAADLGWRSGTRMVRTDELVAADGVWFTSSVRGLAAVRELDGARLPDSPYTGQIRDLLGYRI